MVRMDLLHMREEAPMGKIQYEIISVIKQSNKGNVYLASMEEYAFPVIVKQLKHGNLAVFESLRKMSSKYIPRIYQWEETEAGLLVAEEYIDGELLSEYLQKKKLTQEECFGIAIQLCEGLKALHEQKPPVIHRDIKPSNIIVNSDGIVKIIDFDSSRQYKEESDSDTRLLGTEKYAAPEQYGYAQTDCRSDIYSLGVVLEKFSRFMTPAKEKRWKKIVEKCTLFAPESRFQTVEEVESEIKKTEKAGRYGRRSAVVAVVGILLFGMALFLWKGKAGDTDAGFETHPTPVSMPVMSPTPTLSPAPTLSPTPTLTPTRRPTVTPFKMWTPSPTPTPTPLPTVTPTPTPLPGPTPTLLPLDLGEPVVNTTHADVVGLEVSKRSPEGRISEADLPEVAVLKKKIAINKRYVQYYFKDRMQRDDLLAYISFFDDARETFIGVKLYSYQSGEWMRLSCTEAMEKDGICHIDGRYMDRLPDGFYQMTIQYRMEGDAGIREHLVYVYVAESDIFNEPVGYIENNRIEYRGEKGVTLHTITRNSFDRRIVSVQWEWGDTLDPSLYTILYGGRAVEYSSYLLERFTENGELDVYLKLSDGTVERVRIVVNPNML